VSFAGRRPTATRSGPGADAPVSELRPSRNR